MKHVSVYANPCQYAGWPANHSAWQTDDDQFLVGFLHGRYGDNPMHNICEPFFHAQARSLDGGNTWTYEETGIPDEVNGMSLSTYALDLTQEIIRVRGTYDHGGDYVPGVGCYYASKDFGVTWKGPFEFSGLKIYNTSRTRVDGNILYMSEGNPYCWGADHVITVENNGGHFTKIGQIIDNGRVVMPAIARVDGSAFAACRRRDGQSTCWIDLYRSDDNGRTFEFVSKVDSTGGDNGNPPALIESDGKLVCCYANRSRKKMHYAVSGDKGKTWHQRELRSTSKSDIGYPQLFKRKDGGLVCVYYWADDENPIQHIAATHFMV